MVSPLWYSVFNDHLFYSRNSAYDRIFLRNYPHSFLQVYGVRLYRSFSMGKHVYRFGENVWTQMGAVSSYDQEICSFRRDSSSSDFCGGLFFQEIKVPNSEIPMMSFKISKHYEEIRHICQASVKMSYLRVSEFVTSIMVYPFTLCFYCGLARSFHQG
ncbi:hypothetical protein CULT_1600012 [[Clostridium] ultunense Esp]|nr:hypothetical protein CULT_1600012 [[Clostridium] ultunense Esp]